MHKQKWSRRVGLLISVLLLLTACSADTESQPTPLLSAIKEPDREEIELVITQFLDRKESIPFHLWTEVDGRTVGSMSGTTMAKKWQLEGEHTNQSFIQLSGRQDKVEWKTKKSSGLIEQKPFGLYSPHEHLNQLRHSFDDIQLIPGNRFEQQKIVQMNLSEEKVKQAVTTMLGEQFNAERTVQEIAQKMEVRYTLWYNKQSHDLHQVKVELFKKGEGTTHKMQSLTYLFGELSN